MHTFVRGTRHERRVLPLIIGSLLLPLGCGVKSLDPESLRVDCFQGDTLACYDLGNLYRSGDGVTRDYSRAFKLFQQACDGGEMGGCNNLGAMYYAGDGVTQDLTIGRISHHQSTEDPLSDPSCTFPRLAYLGSPDIKVGLSPGRSDQELCDLGRKRLIHGFFWDLPEQCFLASVDGRLRRPRSGWGACSAVAKSRRKVLNLWLLLDDRWAGDTAQVVPVR